MLYQPREQIMRMIENTYAAHCASRTLFIGMLALSVSSWAAGQDAKSPGAPGKLNLQLPPQRMSVPSSVAVKDPESDRTDVEAPLQASQDTMRNAPRFSFTDSKEPHPSSVTEAERALRAHKDLFDRQPDCPTPFGSVSSSTDASSQNRLPNCRTWRKPANTR
jgi:hypothetical protein